MKNNHLNKHVEFDIETLWYSIIIYHHDGGDDNIDDIEDSDNYSNDNNINS